MKILNYNEFLNESNDFKYEYGCLMLNFKHEGWKKNVLSLIDEEDIYDVEGFGYEESPHVTVLYGLVPDKTTVKEIKKVVKESDIELNKYYEVKKISIFDNSDDYDVVKMDLTDCKELHNMNKLMTDSFEYENDYPDYYPHITVAYVKKGKGKKYIQKLEKPILLEPDNLVYSEPSEDGDDSIKSTIVKYEKIEDKE